MFDLKRDAMPNVVLNKLYKYTQLQTSFSVNNIALVKGRPQLLSLREMIFHYIDHRHDVVVRRTQYELRKAEERAHILQGLIIAIDNLDEVIALIRGSQTPEEARNGLMEKFELSEIQGFAPFSTCASRAWPGLERDKLRAEYDELMELIGRLKAILEDKGLRMSIIKDELVEVKDKFGDERRSHRILQCRVEHRGHDSGRASGDHDQPAGYIKRTRTAEYNQQSRGGVGSKGAITRDQDFIEEIFSATNLSGCSSSRRGRCFWMRIFEPEGSRTSKGRADPRTSSTSSPMTR